MTYDIDSLSNEAEDIEMTYGFGVDAKGRNYKAVLIVIMRDYFGEKMFQATYVYSLNFDEPNIEQTPMKFCSSLNLTITFEIRQGVYRRRIRSNSRFEVGGIKSKDKIERWVGFCFQI